METKTQFTKAYGVEKGYLQDKIVYLKPIPRGNKMISDPKHSGYFMWEGASKQFCLMTNKYGMLINPFKSEDEELFFSEILDIDLNIYKKEDNFWHDFYVKITKDFNLMSTGIPFNLSDPMDNLRVRILKQQREVADTWEERFNHIEYKFALVEDDHEELVQNKEMDTMEAIFTYWGEIKSSVKKMRDFLSIYWMTKRTTKEVPLDATKEFLTTEIKKLIDSDKEGVYNVITDSNLQLKLFIAKGIRAGAIVKEGVGTYYTTGNVDNKYSLEEFIGHVKFLKESTDPIYLKIEAQINSQKV
jgi:hypothetical protein